MFRFLWISAGHTYLALLVNAKEVSGDVRFRRKLLFRCCSIISRFPLFMYLQLFFRFLIVLAEYFYSLVFIWFRCSLIKFVWNGSSHFMMSMHTFCDSLNKSLGWIIFLISSTVVWSFGCRLNSFGHVSRCGVLKLFIYTIVIIWLVCPRMLQFTEETVPKFTRISILSVI